MEAVKFEMNECHIENYMLYLEEAEKAKNTREKYQHDLYTLLSWLEERTLCKRELIKWKEMLVEQYAPRTVNALLAAVNSFFRFMGWSELQLRPLKLQRTLFYDEGKELTKEEYSRLVRTARRLGKERIAVVLQTICATGIRVSELRFITCEAVLTGRAEIHNKGKIRIIFLPKQLRKILRNYIRTKKITAGAVFVTKSGKPMDRSNIWREMKSLCEAANVEPDKVFPHNLRHLFARCFYQMEKDLSRLADLLGHSSINTTRIYTAESGRNHAELVGRLGLVIT